MLLLYRLGPESLYAVRETTDAAGDDAGGELRHLLSEPFETPPSEWRLGDRVRHPRPAFLVPVTPSKIIGIGRNYRAHAAELNNPMPEEPLLFLKAPSTLIGHRAPIVLPPESQRVEFEGEIALVIGRRLRRADAATAARAIFGVTCACDVTARDLQRKDATFARGKSFDTFCPLGPAIRVCTDDVEADLNDLEVTTRVNGDERQRGHVQDMEFPLLDLLVYASRMMTLEPGDLVLTGTPAGVGPLQDGDEIEVEVSGVGVLRNPVEAWRGARQGARQSEN